ncbi:hypothetical protein ACFX13_044349 [Malus domestica]
MASILGLKFTKSGELSFSPTNKGGRGREPMVDCRQNTRRICSELAYSSREQLATATATSSSGIHTFSGIQVLFTFLGFSF